MSFLLQCFFYTTYISTAVLYFHFSLTVLMYSPISVNCCRVIVVWNGADPGEIGCKIQFNLLIYLIIYLLIGLVFTPRFIFHLYLGSRSNCGRKPGIEETHFNLKWIKYVTTENIKREAYLMRLRSSDSFSKRLGPCYRNQQKAVKSVSTSVLAKLSPFS